MCGAVWQRRLVIGFLLLGIAARAVRFFLRFPLWEDECFLAVSFIDRGYADMLAPLSYHQVAPLLFLWIELTMVKLFGFNEWSLRLFPFVASTAALLLFARLARRILTGEAFVFAVAWLAVAYPAIRYSAEAKQYGSDLFVAVLLLTLTLEWRASGLRPVWLWALAAVMPLAVGLSHPGVFVAGGVSLYVALLLFRSPQPRGWIAWAALNLSLLGSFAPFFFVSIRVQADAELAFQSSFYSRAFPPLDSFTSLLGWLITTHTGQMLAYPVGSDRGGSIVTSLLCLAGVVAFCRERRWPLLLLLIGPIGLHLLAAVLGRYPYGVHFKLSQPHAPTIAILSAVGLGEWIGRLHGRGWREPRMVTAAVAILAAIALLSIARDVRFPYKTFSDQRARAFAQWFWFDLPHSAEVVGMKTDLGLTFSPETYRQVGWSAMYLTNQRIYSPRHRARRAPDWDSISSTHPLRVVEYRDPDHPYDKVAFQRWLREMEGKYRLANRDVYPVPRYDKREGRLIKTDEIHVFTFVPVTQ